MLKSPCALVTFQHPAMQTVPAPINPLPMLQHLLSISYIRKMTRLAKWWFFPVIGVVPIFPILKNRSCLEDESTFIRQQIFVMNIYRNTPGVITICYKRWLSSNYRSRYLLLHIFTKYDEHRMFSFCSYMYTWNWNSIRRLLVMNPFVFHPCDQHKKEGCSLRHTLLQLFILLNTSACYNMPIDVSILRSKPLHPFVRLLCHSLV